MGIAAMRAIESEKPAGERICYDPYARRFLPGWFYTMLRLFIRSGYAEWRGRGVIGFLAARERCIDDYLESRLKEGFDQLVILGAGFDARAYRYAGLPQGGIHIFEVDHPATQKDKIEKVRFILGRLPKHVSYVAVDFNISSLAERLAAHGYNPQAKTVFLWQGVTYYLEPSAIDSTLAFIAQHSAPGSSVIFDYIDEALLTGPTNHTEVHNMRRYRGMTGEALRFGIPVADIEKYLSQRGFDQVCNVRSEELKARYFLGKNEARNVMAGYAIVSAVVKQPVN